SAVRGRGLRTEEKCALPLSLRPALSVCSLVSVILRTPDSGPVTIDAAERAVDHGDGDFRCRRAHLPKGSLHLSDVIVSELPVERPLPQPRTSLVGRERETDVILRLLNRPDVPLVTITGPSGVGKS